MGEPVIKRVDTTEYLSMLRGLVEEGRTVSLLVSGSSMSPFLCHERDFVYFQKPDRELARGDIVFYQRDSGQFVMHRICRVRKDAAGTVTYDLIGDNQSAVEHGIRRDQIFGLITEVKRKGIMIRPRDFWWEFFAKVWIRIIPLRRIITNIYGMLYRKKM